MRVPVPVFIYADKPKTKLGELADDEQEALRTFFDFKVYSAQQ